MNQEVTITSPSSTVLAVESPYSAAFVGAAKALGGRWHAPSRSWQFDARDEDDVRALCLEHYGTDGRADVARVDVRIAVHREQKSDRGPFSIGNHALARASGRDSGARLADGVKLAAGTLYSHSGERDGVVASGGSVRHWTTYVGAGCVFVARDVSEHDVQLAQESYEATSGQIVVEVIEASRVDVDALRAERERLIARLAEIDEQLGES